MWADLTRDGRREATQEIELLVAGRMYSEALTLAIAVEMDRARREAAPNVDALTAAVAKLAVRLAHEKPRP